MIEIVIALLSDMSGRNPSVFGMNFTSFFGSPEEFRGGNVWTLMTRVSDVAVLPIASTIIVLLFLVELLRLVVNSDLDREVLLLKVTASLVKFGLLWAALAMSTLIMRGIIEVFVQLTQKVNSAVGDPSINLNLQKIDVFAVMVAKLDWLGKVLVVILLLLAWLVYHGAMLVAIALLVMRFVKIYLYVALAPIPLALLAHQDSRSYGIGFLRTFAAVLLQAVVIMMAFVIYQSLSVGWGEQALTLTENMNGISAALMLGGNFIFMGIVLFMVVIGSGRVANEIMGH